MNIFNRDSVKRAAWRVIHARPKNLKKPEFLAPTNETDPGTLGGILAIFILAFMILAVLITLFNW